MLTGLLVWVKPGIVNPPAGVGVITGAVTVRTELPLHFELLYQGAAGTVPAADTGQLPNSFQAGVPATVNPVTVKEGGSPVTEVTVGGGGEGTPAGTTKVNEYGVQTDAAGAAPMGPLYPHPVRNKAKAVKRNPNRRFISISPCLIVSKRAEVLQETRNNSVDEAP